MKFLIDTGAAVSIIPPQYISVAPIYQSPVSLTTATGDPIAVVGEALVSLNIASLRRSFQHTFVVAKVTHPLLGLDFLKKYNLNIDCGALMLTED